MVYASWPHQDAVRHIPVVGPVARTDLHVMSWNIRRRARGLQLRSADRWTTRAPHLQALLEAERPTLLGVQEALADQAFFARTALGENYAVVGRGRGSRGGGEGNPILYDAERLELIDWHQAALSTTPNKPGSRSWGSVYPRIMVHATFADQVEGSRFVHINTHLDHLSPYARLMAARVIHRVVEATTVPIVLTGDLNADAASKPLATLRAGDSLTDTWPAAEQRLTEEWDTCANYKPPKATGRRIDWILASSSFRVASAAVNAGRYAGGWASDHLPVQAVLRRA